MPSLISNEGLTSIQVKRVPRDAKNGDLWSEAAPPLMSRSLMACAEALLVLAGQSTWAEQIRRLRRDHQIVYAFNGKQWIAPTPNVAASGWLTISADGCSIGWLAREHESAPRFTCADGQLARENWPSNVAIVNRYIGSNPPRLVGRYFVRASEG